MVFHLIFTVIKGQAVAQARAVAHLEHPSIRGPSEDSRVALLVGDQRPWGALSTLWLAVEAPGAT